MSLTISKAMTGGLPLTATFPTHARLPRRLVRDDDPCIAAAVTLDQRIQCRRMRRVQPDAAMRSRTAETAEVVGAVDRKTVIEEYRMRHRRIVIFPRKPAPRHHLRMKDAARGAVAAAPGRDRPAVARRAVDAHRHVLG